MVRKKFRGLFCCWYSCWVKYQDGDSFDVGECNGLSIGEVEDLNVGKWDGLNIATPLRCNNLQNSSLV